MRKSAYRAVRINEALAQRVELLAESIGYSFNHFAEVAITEVVDLCECPATQRQQPKICAMVDAANAPQPLLVRRTAPIPPKVH